MPYRIWIMVICAGSVLGLALGIRQGLGLFMTPISLNHGSGREAFAISLGLMNLLWGLGAPFAGAIADRYGAQRVAVVGGLLYAFGLLLMMASNHETHLALSGVLIGLGLSGAAFTIVLGVVGRATPEKFRSKALGLVSVGGSIGQFIALPYIHALIGGFGWVYALGLLAVTALMIVPLAIGLKEPAYTTESEQCLGSQSLGDAVRSAAKVPSFWFLNAGFLACGFHLSFVGVHLPAFLADQGFQPWLATTAMAIIGLTNIVGVYIFALLGDSYSKKFLLVLLYIVRTVAILAFILSPMSEISVLTFSAIMGFLWLGTVPLTSGLVAHIFGSHYLSTLFGIVFLGHQLGGFFGSWLAGLAFDTFGSYDVIWWLSVAIGLSAALLHWPIRETKLSSTEPRLKEASIQ